MLPQNRLSVKYLRVHSRSVFTLRIRVVYSHCAFEYCIRTTRSNLAFTGVATAMSMSTLRRVSRYAVQVYTQ
ncbi:MAG: hypothetical protein ACK45R_09115 [Candidatus Kapaibacterium sp.]